MKTNDLMRGGATEARQPVSVCLLGAPGDTTNLGVDALLESTVIGLRRSVPDVRITVFDNGLGRRRGTIDGPGEPIEFDRLGIRASRRMHRPESLLNMTVSARTGFPPNAGVKRLREASAVLDISGGDSFSDLYGQRRFDAIAGQKSVALRTGRPLVLLPQTYGPFEGEANRNRAARLVRGAESAWARDAASFDVLVSLLDRQFDPSRHRQGVDVAFALPSRRPRALDDRVASWLEDDVPVFGVNVSGLLANDTTSDSQFGLTENYSVLIERLLLLLLERTDARLLLVPHVLSDLWVVESDVAACRRFADRLAAARPERIAALEGIDRAQEVKWVIGKCDAFCGTRMHSTIAALSTCTPALALAYSPKTWGVFESCGQGDRVADLRRESVESIERRVLSLWSDRTAVVDELRAAMPSVIERAHTPFVEARQLMMDDR